MWHLSLIPFALQALAIGVDEIVFHRRRGLPRWERIGHPVDTATVLLCMGYVLFVPYSKQAILPYALLAILSSLMITKDEFVHKEHCPALEQWLHALLFILHPITLLSAALIWPVSQGVESAAWLSSWIEEKEFLRSFLRLQFFAMSLFMAYQVIYWNFIWKTRDDQQ
jgi:hypothetical protein